MRIKHTSNAVRDVIDGSFRVIEELPVIVGSIEDMSRIDLDEQEKNLFAQAAMQVRFEGKPAPITEAQVLRPRRFEDEKSDLWTTFNVIEENLMRGGQRGRNANGRRQRTRAITGIDGNVSLNQALWTLAEGMKKLKLAA
jgi:hypothetical protein